MRAHEFLAENADTRYLAMLRLPIRYADGSTRPFYSPELDSYVRKTRLTLKRQDRIVWAMRIFRAMLASELRLVIADAVTGEVPAVLGGTPSPDQPPDLARLEAELDQMGVYDSIRGFNTPEWLKRQPVRKGRNRDFEIKLAEKAFMGPLAYSGLDELLGKLEHWLGFGEAHATAEPHNAILTTVFDRQPIPVIFKLFRKEELRLQKKYEGATEDDGTTLIAFPDGYKWVDLGRAYCSKEAKAMGHCGNAPAKNSKQTILSLRAPMPNGVAGVRPVLTFILHPDGSLGQMKGRANTKPKREYHDYIIALLNHPRITGIRGGGYAAENNFSLGDLPREDWGKVSKLIPQFPGFSLSDIDKFSGMHYRSRDGECVIWISVPGQARLQYEVGGTVVELPVPDLIRELEEAGGDGGAVIQKHRERLRRY